MLDPKHVMSGDETASLLSLQYGVPSINLQQFEIAASVIRLIPPQTARRYRIVPVGRCGTTLTVAMVDPANVSAIDDIAFLTGCTVEPVVASESAVFEALQRYYPHTRAPDGTTGDPSSLDHLTRVLEETSALAHDEVDVLETFEEIDVAALDREGGEAPVIRLVNLVLMSAIHQRASDIHLEPYERELRVRFRIDGVLYTVVTPPLRIKDAITSRLKVMAKLDIAEKRLPQDGRIRLRVTHEGSSRDVDLRVSCLPTLFGETIVLRLLDRESLSLDLTQLGLEPESLRSLEAAIARPWGMVLVTGPTGCGKTSTLYSSIARLNTPGTNIVTAEDPVEFNLAGVNQLQIRDAIGLTFATALRSFLRQDPNVILVGEIRDGATAEIAVKAALTGHLVLSTLHTNDAPSSITRLMNMGIEPFLVAGSLNLICAQRLVRRICTKCRTAHGHAVPALVEAGLTAEEACRVEPKKGTGCGCCNHTGYRGRIGLYEVMEITDGVRELILSGASSADLRRKAIEQGMITLRRSGLQKVVDGITTIDEVVRETVK